MISDPYVRSTLLALALPGRRVATRPITSAPPGRGMHRPRAGADDRRADRAPTTLGRRQAREPSSRPGPCCPHSFEDGVVAVVEPLPSSEWSLSQARAYGRYRAVGGPFVGANAESMAPAWAKFARSRGITPCPLRVSRSTHAAANASPAQRSSSQGAIFVPSSPISHTTAQSHDIELACLWRPALTITKHGPRAEACAV